MVNAAVLSSGPARGGRDPISVTAGSAFESRPVLVGATDQVQVSVVLGEFSNKVSGSLDTSVQASNDGQNWRQLYSMSNDFSKAGTVQTATVPISATLLRVVMEANPGGNTVFFSSDISLGRL